MSGTDELGLLWPFQRYIYKLYRGSGKVVSGHPSGHPRLKVVKWYIIELSSSRPFQWYIIYDCTPPPGTPFATLAVSLPVFMKHHPKKCSPHRLHIYARDRVSESIWMRCHSLVHAHPFVSYKQKLKKLFFPHNSKMELARPLVAYIIWINSLRSIKWY